MTTDFHDRVVEHDLEHVHQVILKQCIEHLVLIWEGITKSLNSNGPQYFRIISEKSLEFCQSVHWAAVTLTRRLT